MNRKKETGRPKPIPFVAKKLSKYIEIFEKNFYDQYINDDYRLYFRGEKEDYGNTKCIPSLFRKDIYKSNISKNESDHYYRTLRRFPSEFVGMSNLDVLAKMQHYGSNTRLLDITTNPLIALYFALEESLDIKGRDKDAFVYVFFANKDKVLSYDSDRALLISTLAKLKPCEQQKVLDYIKTHNESHEITPKELEKHKNTETGKAIGRYMYECERERHAFHQNHQAKVSDIEGIFFVKPQFVNERLKAQDGLFILVGLGQREIKDVLSTRITIPGKYKRRIMAELLFFAGISDSKILQDLETLRNEKKDDLYEIIKDYDFN